MFEADYVPGARDWIWLGLGGNFQNPLMPQVWNIEAKFSLSRFLWRELTMSGTSSTE